MENTRTNYGQSTAFISGFKIILIIIVYTSLKFKIEQSRLTRT